MLEMIIMDINGLKGIHVPLSIKIKKHVTVKLRTEINCLKDQTLEMVKK